MKHKVRIIKNPVQQTMAYGGQTNYGLDLRHNYSLGHYPNEDETINNSIKPVDREDATIEAEKGETVLIPTKGGLKHFTIPGKKHAQGGTPLDVPEGSFVFSDTRKMKIGGDVLSFFNKSDKKPLTPAKIAKQYKLNTYNDVLKNATSDKFDIDTAQLMIDNNTKKLGVLASLQESKKGYPNGIPEVSKTGEMKYGGFSLPQAKLGMIYKEDFDLVTNPMSFISKDEHFFENPYSFTAPTTEQPKTQQTSSDIKKSNQEQPYKWTTPDKLNLVDALYNLSAIKKTSPWEPVVNLQTPNTTFYSPDRALSANSAEASSTQRNNSMLAGPQARYMNTFVQGKAAENAANLIGQYGEKNVSLQNNFNDRNSQTTNQQITMNAERAKRLYDAGVIGEQQYQNAIRTGRKALNATFNQGFNNASTMYNLNQTTADRFRIDPTTGLMKFISPDARDKYFANKTSTGMPTFEEYTRMGGKSFSEWFNAVYGKNTKRPLPEQDDQTP